MKKILRAVLSAAVGAIGLAACDAAAPPDAAVSPSVESEAAAAGEAPAAAPGAVEPKAAAAGEAPAAAPRPVEPEETVDPEVIALAETLAGLVRNDDVFARARKLGELLPTLGPEAVPAIEMTLENPTLEYGASDAELLVRFWAIHQPADAARWAALKSPLVYRAAAILASFTPWAEKDPQAVLKATREWGMQPREVRDAMQLALVRGWFEANPTEVAQFIKEIGMSVERQQVVSAYVRAMIKTQGTGAVMRWAESLPGDDAVYKTTVYRQVGSALPLFDHDAALSWCKAHCDGPYGNNLRNVIGRRWARSDGPAAMAWLSTAPEGHEKNLALRAAFAAWAQDDREAAMRWMAAQAPTQTAEEPASWLRPIFPIYARLLAPDSPAEAVKWAEWIENEEEREIVLIGVARVWRKADEAAADAWLLQSPLSEEAREKVRSPAPQRRPGGRPG